MANQKWCIKTTDLYDKPGGNKRGKVLLNRIYDYTGKQQVFRNNPWSEIKFIDKDGIDKRGWVRDVYLEDYIDDPTSHGFEVHIPNPTADSTDAAQYMKWESDTKYVNMCGELCVAFIGGDDIETFLNKWKQMDGSFYHLIIPKDRGTSADEVNNMLKIYGYPDKYISFDEGLTDADTGRRVSPGRFQKMLKTHYLIAAVRIDNVAGNIGGGDVGHWVIVDKVITDGIDRGWVEIYNPFPNKRQIYSYDEFIRSCNAEGWTGLWVGRTPPSPGV